VLFLIVLSLVIPTIGLPVGVIYFLRHQKAKWSQSWAQVGESCGLVLAPRDSDLGGAAEAYLAGTVEGRRVELFSFVRGEDQVVTISISEVRTGRLQLEIEREGFLSQVEKLVGAREVETGDPRFDRRFYIHTSHEGPTKELLDRKVRRALRRAEVDAVEVEAGTITLRYEGFDWWKPSRGADRLPELFRAGIAAALTTADRLEGVDMSGEASPPTPRPAAARAVVPIASVLALVALFAFDHFARVGLVNNLEEDRRELNQSLRESSFALEVISVASSQKLDEEFKQELAKRAEVTRRFRMAELIEQERSMIEERDSQAQERLDDLRTYYRTQLKSGDEAQLQARLTQAVEELRRDEELGALAEVSQARVQGVLDYTFARGP
jgi:hypothetical protein